jgi:dihydropyrimidinase
MPFMGQVTCDDFFSGQAAALAGGTTMHIDFALPTNGSLAAGFKTYQERASTSCMDYGFHMIVTAWNDNIASDMEMLVKNQGKDNIEFLMLFLLFSMLMFLLLPK